MTNYLTWHTECMALIMEEIHQMPDFDFVLFWKPAHPNGVTEKTFETFDIKGLFEKGASPETVAELVLKSHGDKAYFDWLKLHPVKIIERVISSDRLDTLEDNGEYVDECGHTYHPITGVRQ